MYIMRGKTWPFAAVILITVYVVVAPAIACAQSKFPARESSYGAGRMNTADGYQIDFSRITLGNNTFIYSPQKSRDTVSIEAAKVLKVEVQSGSRAGEMGALFFISGLIGSLATVQRGQEQIENVGGESDSGTETAIVVGFTAGMTLVGILIGSTIKEYETVYTHPEFGFKLKEKHFDFIMVENRIMICINI